MPSKNLATINNGWPFSDGPLRRPMRFDYRDGRVFIVCAHEGQVIMALTDQDPDPVQPAYTLTLEDLKARVVDHWLKCHEAEIAAETHC